MIQKISVIIVDDEPLAIRGLELRLQAFKDISIIDTCKNGREAIKSIKALKPDLVFLDIQMPGYDGFAVIKALSDQKLPIFIFVTAYDQYAVDAFETHAMDYLLKPVDEERLTIAIRRVREKLNEQIALNQNEKLLQIIRSLDGNFKLRSQINHEVTASRDSYESRINIKNDGEIECVNVDEVEWIDAAGDYLCVHANGETHIIRETMKRMANRLDPSKFQRVHRSAIVNLNKISRLHSRAKGQYFLSLSCGKEIKISRRYKDIFSRFL